MNAREGWSNIPNWIVALSTVTLVLVTMWYVSLTNRLVRLQIAPFVEAGFDKPFGTPNFVLRNSGSEPVANVSVYWTSYTFRDPSRPPVLAFSSSSASPSVNASSDWALGWQSPWWNIARFVPGQEESRGTSEIFDLIAKNEEAMRKTFEMAQARQGTRPTDISLTSVVVFLVTYNREADGKQFQITKSSIIRRDSSTGKPFIEQQPFYFNPKNLQEALLEEFLSRQNTSSRMNR